MSDLAQNAPQVNSPSRNTSDIRHSKIDRAISEIWGLVANGKVSEEYAVGQVAKLTRERDAEKIDSRKAAKRQRRDKTLRWISSGVPPQLRHLFPGTAVIAVANYILAQVKRCGVCEQFYAKIACATGTCTKTVQRAVRALKEAGLDVRFGSYDPRSGKNVATRIKTTCNKLYSWITRNVVGGGLQSPSTSIKESFHWRPARTDGAISRLSRALRRKPPD